ncbi:hypothetical protein D3C71_1671110 [compost metagenome]
MGAIEISRRGLGFDAGKGINVGWRKKLADRLTDRLDAIAGVERVHFIQRCIERVFLLESAEDALREIAKYALRNLFTARYRLGVARFEQPDMGDAGSADHLKRRIGAQIAHLLVIVLLDRQLNLTLRDPVLDAG